MSEIRLKGAGVVPLGGKRVPAGMPQHVSVRLEAELRLRTANGALVTFTQGRIRMSRDYTHRRGISDQDMQTIVSKTHKPHRQRKRKAFYRNLATRTDKKARRAQSINPRAIQAKRGV